MGVCEGGVGGKRRSGFLHCGEYQMIELDHFRGKP